jgi:hypothetical protein
LLLLVMNWLLVMNRAAEKELVTNSSCLLEEELVRLCFRGDQLQLGWIDPKNGMLIWRAPGGCVPTVLYMTVNTSVMGCDQLTL